MKNSFGEALGNLIDEKRISYQQLASELNVSLTTIYRWKANKKDIGLSYLLKIARYFDCSLEYLTGRTDTDFKVNHKKDIPLISANIRKVMLEKGVSTYLLRKQTHFDGAYFYNWDKGSDPKLSTLIELADYLKCTLDYLVGID